MTYQISSRTGRRHQVDGPFPSNAAALDMWNGRGLPVARCGRTIQPVNFYQPDEPVYVASYQCKPCAAKEDQ